MSDFSRKRSTSNTQLERSKSLRSRSNTLKKQETLHPIVIDRDNIHLLSPPQSPPQSPTRKMFKTIYSSQNDEMDSSENDQNQIDSIKNYQMDLSKNDQMDSSESNSGKTTIATDSQMDLSENDQTNNLYDNEEKETLKFIDKSNEFKNELYEKFKGYFKDEIIDRSNNIINYQKNIDNFIGEIIVNNLSILNSDYKMEDDEMEIYCNILNFYLYYLFVDLYNSQEINSQKINSQENILNDVVPTNTEQTIETKINNNDTDSMNIDTSNKTEESKNETTNKDDKNLLSAIGFTGGSCIFDSKEFECKKQIKDTLLYNPIDSTHDFCKDRGNISFDDIKQTYYYYNAGPKTINSDDEINNYFFSNDPFYNYYYDKPKSSFESPLFLKLLSGNICGNIQNSYYFTNTNIQENKNFTSNFNDNQLEGLLPKSNIGEEISLYNLNQDLTNAKIKYYFYDACMTVHKNEKFNQTGLNCLCSLWDPAGSISFEKKDLVYEKDPFKTKIRLESERIINEDNYFDCKITSDNNVSLYDKIYDPLFNDNNKHSLVEYGITIHLRLCLYGEKYYPAVKIVHTDNNNNIEKTEEYFKITKNLSVSILAEAFRYVKNNYTETNNNDQVEIRKILEYIKSILNSKNLTDNDIKNLLFMFILKIKFTGDHGTILTTKVYNEIFDDKSVLISGDKLCDIGGYANDVPTLADVYNIGTDENNEKQYFITLINVNNVNPIDAFNNMFKDLFNDIDPNNSLPFFNLENINTTNIETTTNQTIDSENIINDLLKKKDELDDKIINILHNNTSTVIENINEYTDNYVKLIKIVKSETEIFFTEENKTKINQIKDFKNPLELFKNENNNILQNIDKIYKVLIVFRKSLYTYINIDKIKAPYVGYLNFQKERIDKYFNIDLTNTTRPSRFFKLFRNDLSRAVSETESNPKKSIVDILKGIVGSGKPSNIKSTLNKIKDSFKEQYKNLKIKITKKMTEKQKEDAEKKNEELQNEINSKLSEKKTESTENSSSSAFDEIENNKVQLQKKEITLFENITKTLGKDIGNNCKYILSKIKYKIKNSISGAIDNSRTDYSQKIDKIIDLVVNTNETISDGSSMMNGGGELDDSYISIEQKYFLDEIINRILFDEIDQITSDKMVIGGKSNHKKTFKRFNKKTIRNKTRHKKTYKNKRIKKIIMIKKTKKIKHKKSKRKTYKKRI